MSRRQRYEAGVQETLDKLQKQIDSISEKPDAHEQPGEPAPAGQLQRVSAERNFAPEVVNQNQPDQDKSYRLQTGTFWIGVLTLVALIIYTTLTYRQWKAILESNRISREGLTSVQRAFIFMDGFTSSMNVDNSGKPVGVRIAARWRNSGTTPAIDATSWANSLGGPLSPGFAYPDLDLFDRPMAKSLGAPVFFPPQFSVIVHPWDLDIPTIKAIQRHELEWHFYGWARYRDVFSGTERHIVRFCYDVAEIRGDFAVNRGFDIGLMPCKNDPGRNCADAGCKEQ